ncbi:hypothetical protein RSOLAG1IB_06709 [Rhizoctonia solani AG-1 IB]|uniref:Uncharacterized protein n=1 Tax=Thanatephorus cucumeris (strain AG1-IB / isolate 7/3/14) TaxID=1108050 RepID=A0A0B7FCG0_THACB|nr:hypothetical protein RSOLAG1IB_06709 [Rhizoctonia solani AG-1 IB]
MIIFGLCRGERWISGAVLPERGGTLRPIWPRSPSARPTTPPSIDSALSSAPFRVQQPLVARNVSTCHA